jgi:hypothetical protein
MQNESVLLATGSTVVGAGTLDPKTFKGGRGTLVVEATTYGTGCALQMQGPGTAWIQVFSSVVGNGVISVDLPAGQYRMQNIGSTVIGLYGALCPTR